MHTSTRPSTHWRSHDGFTLIELMVVVVLVSVAGGLGVTALSGYSKAQDFQGSADLLVSDMRKAGQRALAEGRTYCLHVQDAADTWSLYRGACGIGGTLVEGPTRALGDVALGNLSIATASGETCPQTLACVYFKPRGTATQSAVDVIRDGSTITVTVEGLTARVDRTD